MQGTTATMIALWRVPQSRVLLLHQGRPALYLRLPRSSHHRPGSLSMLPEVLHHLPHASRWMLPEALLRLHRASQWMLLEPCHLHYQENPLMPPEPCRLRHQESLLMLREAYHHLLLPNQCLLRMTKMSMTRTSTTLRQPVLPRRLLLALRRLPRPKDLCRKRMMMRKSIRVLPHEG